MSRRLLTLLAASLFTVPSFSYAVNGNPGGIRSNESINRTQQPVSPHKNNQAKMRIAPHTVTIQTELQTAIDEVKGLKAQLEAIPDQKPGPTVIEHLRMHSKELNSRVKMTATHEQHL
ncbi:MAG TPA: hypothetical protein DCS07_11680 [Bdellovibrionales bacterium]|nr:hypothetical protein [Bdellovibrionales bacterium]